MKKGVLLLFALLMAVIPATAAAETTVLTLEVPQPSYQLNIPSGTGLAYKQESCMLAVPTVASASDFKEGMSLRVTISYSGSFSGEAGQIPYSLSMTDGTAEIGWNSGDYLIFDAMSEGSLNANGHISGGTMPTEMVVRISSSAWEAALPGSYSTAITYSAAVALD